MNIEFCSKGDKDHIQLIVVILSCLYLCFSYGYINVVPKSAIGQSGVELIIMLASKKEMIING